jgi:HSP20 family molecular chaperone IbpA
MAVEGVGDSQARYLAQKRKELQDEKNLLETQTASAKRDRLQAASEQNEKTDKELVSISREGEKQAELLRKLNSERVRTLNENTQQNYQKLSGDTANEIKRLEKESFKAIADAKESHMEKLRFVTERGEDPFYRIKSLNPAMSEEEDVFKVKVALPEFEAQNLFVSGEGQSIKLSLARRFQDHHTDEDNAVSTRTSSYQTVAESLALPKPIDVKGIKKEYADGVVTITVPKAGIFPHSGEA